MMMMFLGIPTFFKSMRPEDDEGEKEEWKNAKNSLFIDRLKFVASDWQIMSWWGQPNRLGISYNLAVLY